MWRLKIIKIKSWFLDKTLHKVPLVQQSLHQILIIEVSVPCELAEAFLSSLVRRKAGKITRLPSPWTPPVELTVNTATQITGQ